MTSAVRPRPSVPASVLALLGYGVAVAAVAVVGGPAASSAGSRYQSLERPPWAPPSWLFGPVWTVLYVTVAVAGWLVWRRVGLGVEMVPYAVQLVLNAAWTPLFFGADRLGPAFADIVALWIAIVATIVLFMRAQRLAGLLLVPYLAWVTYAGALNLAIWQLN
jgi:translocator protein